MFFKRQKQAVGQLAFVYYITKLTPSIKIKKV